MPIFAALPTGGFDRGILFALIPVLTAFLATILVRKFTDQLRWEYATRFSAALSLSLVSAIVSAVLALGLGLLASGSIGPGRFEFLGVDAMMFAGVVFLEVLIPVFIASLVVVSPYQSIQERK